MIFPIAGIVTAFLAAIVGLVGSFRSMPLLADEDIENRDFLNWLEQHVAQQQELYEHLTTADLADPTSVAKLQNAAGGCGRVREHILERSLKRPWENASSVAGSRMWQLGALGLAFVSVACQVAALVAGPQ